MIAVYLWICMYDISFQSDHFHSRERVLYFPVIVAVLVFKKLFHASLIKFEGLLPWCKLNIVNSTTVVAKIKEKMHALFRNIQSHVVMREVILTSLCTLRTNSWISSLISCTIRIHVFDQLLVYVVRFKAKYRNIFFHEELRSNEIDSYPWIILFA